MMVKMPATTTRLMRNGSNSSASLSPAAVVRAGAAAANGAAGGGTPANAGAGAAGAGAAEAGLARLAADGAELLGRVTVCGITVLVHVRETAGRRWEIGRLNL